MISFRASALAVLVALAAACGSASRDGFGAVDGSAEMPSGEDAATRHDAGHDAGSGRATGDAGKSGGRDGGITDGSTTSDARVTDGSALDGATFDSGPVLTGPISGGPCVSGASGATAFRVHWVNGGGRATPSYEVIGLPDTSRWKVGAYGYSIGFTASYVDPYLGPGGLQLDGSDFVDVEISTAGLSQIHSATLAIYGRSYDTTASGSFSWQTFHGTGATASGAVSNVAPYEWYGADIASELPAGDASTLLRIKAGGPSGALVVNRIELCLDAD